MGKCHFEMFIGLNLLKSSRSFLHTFSRDDEGGRGIEYVCECERVGGGSSETGERLVRD